MSFLLWLCNSLDNVLNSCLLFFSVRTTRFLNNLLTLWPLLRDLFVRRRGCSSKIKSCALDPVPAHVLQECLSVFLPAMTKIVNLSIKSALVPNCFKLALSNPLLKKPRLDFEIYANFRPISNLIFISKLTENVVASQLVDYVLRNDLDETFQSAYKQLHSTETALVRVNNDILVALDNH